MLSLVIGIMGKISVGKSTIARALSNRLNIPIVSFGSYLVKYSVENHLPTDRESLQDLGEKLIYTDAKGFLENVLLDRPEGCVAVIVEGIRHTTIFSSLKALANESIFVYIDATDETRFNRYNRRNKETDLVTSFEEFSVRSRHHVEAEIENLKGACDLTLDSDCYNVNQLVEAIVNGLKGNRLFGF